MLQKRYRQPPIKEENFSRSFAFVGTDRCELITPVNMGCEWVSENLLFRSSMWNADGLLISASFKKFFNWGEKPSITPPPEDLRDCTVVEKLDGSTLIVSKYKGELIVRTRGTFDARKLENGGEIEDVLFKKYPKAFDNGYINSEGFSLLYEWCTPSNIIVLKYSEPLLFLTGAVRHDNYCLLQQEELDQIAKEIEVGRPKYYSFSDSKELIDKISQEVGMEGVCVYYNGGQNILKVKSEEYLRLHRLKGVLNSEKAVLDYWYQLKTPSKEDFLALIESNTDWETKNRCSETVDLIFSSLVLMDKELDEIACFVRDNIINHNLSRAEAARLIMSNIDRSWCSAAFNLLDGKPQTGESSHRKFLEKIIDKVKNSQ